MSTILILILIYLLYLLLRPVFKVWRTVNKVKHGDFSTLGDLFGQPGAQKSSSAYDADGHRKAGWTKVRFSKKKIGKDVGEYVKFREIPRNEQEQPASSDHQPTAFTTEQQVTDVEWEDIK